MNSPERLPLTLPEGLPDARALVQRVVADALSPDPLLLVADWADAHRKLSTKASAEAGEWRTQRTPYLREIMNAMSPSHPATDGDFMKGTQIGGSEALYNAIGYTVDQVPCPTMLVMPTTDTAKRISGQRIQPMIDESPVLARKLGNRKSRDGGNTQLSKDYPGGLLLITGANSGPGLRSTPIRVLFMDEIDAYPDDVDGEGDPCTLAEKRTDQFGARAKRFSCSSPKIKGKSRIDRRYQRGTRGQYLVPCPHCAHEQVLVWEGMRWEMEKKRETACAACGVVKEVLGTAPSACDDCGDTAGIKVSERLTDDVADVWYECARCNARIDEHYKTQMLDGGRWVHQMPGIGEVLADDDPHPHAVWAWVAGKVRRYLPRFRRPLSWHLSALYSPLGWFSWRKAVEQRLEADKGGFNEESGESLLQVFYNTVLGQPFEIIGEQPEQHLLKLRAEPYDLGQVPAGGLLLTAFVDVQGNRLEFQVKAYGRGQESWLVDYQQIYYPVGQTQPGPVEWDKLIALRDKAYPHAGGNTVQITAMGVDSGYLTQEVYDFCRKWGRKNVFATKGQSHRGKALLGRPSMVDINHKGQSIKNGLQLWPLGADTGKELIYSRLALKEPGPGYMHFPRGMPDDYYEGLTAEKLIRRKVRGVEVHDWVKTRERNEPLDLEIGCQAAAIYAGVQRLSWDMLERAINPMQRDIFAEQRHAPAATVSRDMASTHETHAADAAPAPVAKVVPAVLMAQPQKSAWVPRRQNWLGR